MQEKLVFILQPGRGLDTAGPFWHFREILYLISTVVYFRSSTVNF